MAYLGLWHYFSNRGRGRGRGLGSGRGRGRSTVKATPAEEPPLHSPVPSARLILIIYIYRILLQK